MQSELMFLCSGEFSGVGVHIEELTGRFWDSVFQPLLNKVSQGVSQELERRGRRQGGKY